MELPLMSSSVVPADRGCVIAADEGFGIAFVPGPRVLNDHEPEFDCWPLTARKGFYRLLLGPDSCVHLRPMTAGVPRAAAAIASAMKLPESPCLLPAL